MEPPVSTLIRSDFDQIDDGALKLRSAHRAAIAKQPQSTQKVRSVARTGVIQPSPPNRFLDRAPDLRCVHILLRPALRQPVLPALPTVGISVEFRSRVPVGAETDKSPEPRTCACKGWNQAISSRPTKPGCVVQMAAIVESRPNSVLIRQTVSG